MNPLSRRPVWLRVLAAIALAAIFVWQAYQQNQQNSPGSSPPSRSESQPARSPARPGGLAPGQYAVERVVDGDTLMVTTRQGPARVRMQGINTPETVKDDTPVEEWGPEATAFTKAFVRAAGNRLEVEVDGEPRDQYDRYLAFFWHDGKLLNEELVRAGLARAKLAYDYSQPKKDRLRRAQQEAQRAKRGLWSGALSR